MKKITTNTTPLLKVTSFKMRTVLFIFCSIIGLLFTMDGMAQESKVTLSAKKQTIAKIMNEIEQQTHLTFFYEKTGIDVTQTATISVKNEPLGTVLSKLFAGTSVTYKLIDKHIILSNNSNSVQKGKSSPKTRKKIKGRVTAINGDPIIGATVREVGNSKNGTITDIDGNYNLEIDTNDKVEISCIGFQSKIVKAGNDVVLKEDSKMMDELVVVGFGTQKKVNLTGAVEIIDKKQLTERPVTTAAQALQGVVPGLQITQTSGSLNSHPSVNVRGTTTIGEGTSGDPLILIDGMEGDLNTINPQDIETISVLKDAASSSIYGSRAPFGVILVTTKSGGKSNKPVVNYNNSFRISSPLNMLHTMNSLDFATWVNDSEVNMGSSIYFKTNSDKTGRFDQILAYHNATPVGPGTRQTADGTLLYSIEAQPSGQWYGGYSRGIDDVDWYDMVYRNQSFSQEHNISMSGGNEKFNYYTSGNFLNQGSLLNMGDESLKRYTATVKLNAQLTHWLKVNYNMRFAREDYNKPYQLNSSLYSALACHAWPILPAYDRNGNHYYSNTISAWGLIDGGQSITQTDNLAQQIGFTIEPIKRWITHIDLNYRTKSADNRAYQLNCGNHDINGNSYASAKSSVHQDFLKENYYNFDVHTEYSFTLNDKHNFHMMTGLQIEDLKQKLFGLTRSGVILDSKPEVDLTTGLENGIAVTPSTNGESDEWATIGIFGRFNYDYDGKYLVEANLRGDGSSRFRKGNQWKLFPSISLGWNIAYENFFKPFSSTINTLKIRLSYGALGNQNTTNWYQTYQTITTSASAGTWLQNGTMPNITYSPNLVSEYLSWETIESYNVGIDWGLLNNRLTGSFNWYVRNTNNMVGNAPELPAILGTDVPKTNNTDLRTSGWELSIGWRDQLKNGLNYGARIMLFDSRSKIIHYPNNPTELIDNYIEGRYIGEIWGYVTKGLAKTDEEMTAHIASLSNGGQDALGSDWKAGDIMYEDINGDGKISTGSGTLNDPGDKKVIGNTTPRYQFGIDLTASWKNFDFRAFFQGVLKRDYWQGSNYLFGSSAKSWGLWGAASITAVNDYFRNEDTWSVSNGYRDSNIDAYLPRPLYNDKNVQCQTRFLQNAAYMRLKNLQIGYTLPQSLTSKWMMNSLRFFISAENLFTISNIDSQFDPETIETSDGAAYPLSKTISFGLSLTF